MPARVTQSMLNMQLVSNLNRNTGRMDKLQDQLSTGLRINKPSDDPVGITFSVRYRSEVSANEQFITNTDAGRSWLEYTDTMLSQIGDVLQRTRELVTNAANGSNPEGALKSISLEIQQLYEQLVGIGNSEFNGKYVFNGELTDIKPYTPGIGPHPDTGEPTFLARLDDTDDKSIRFEIGAAVLMPVNLTGQQVFGPSTDEDNLFKLYEDITKLMENVDYEGLSSSLAQIDSRLDKVLELRSDIGAKVNRIELAEGRLQDINLNLKTLLTKVEGADMAALITDIKVAENIYQASLSTGARIIQPSLVDFLK